MDKLVITNHDIWCFSASKKSARIKIKRGKSKAHRAKAKLFIKKGILN